MTPLRVALAVALVAQGAEAGTPVARSVAAQPPEQASSRGGTYTLVVEGYDWGAGVSKVILATDEPVPSTGARDYTVSVKRRSDCAELPPDQADGERMVLDAYASDAKGERREGGGHVALALAVAPQWPIGSPLTYVRNDKCRGTVWVDYQVTATRKSSGRVWNTPAGRISPIVDRFDLSGKHTYAAGKTLTYASFVPRTSRPKSPLLIWLHGGGEGGSDPAIPLLANRATAYASDAIQALFDGAYVLVPQTPGAWMHNAAGVMTSGKEDDVYNAPLMGLIREYVASHPGIDPDRVYVGGCSNGGYMALKLMLLHPDSFAAGFISALAYQSQYLSDAQIKSLARLPIWFVHSADDTTTRPEQTVLPVYERLKAAGATNVHLSYYDHVVDVTGLFGGDDHRYDGHWSWIYLHANQARLDRDGSPVRLGGRPVNVMEWLAAQARAR
jgi:poly(3-hydroxybutyrate) depolymerase